MASIQKLSIRGVRSFSPDDDEQVIEFCTPLTMIVGANGCGKTTIIESLKYAVTGSLPPASKNGVAFVHDPKACNQSVVKANIKLRFSNRAGKTMVVIRSMEVTQKKATASFKALDGVIRSTNEDGERVSLSHKCSELDRQIPNLIGVSAPILEHVVFCHQEESSWPLQEGAVLKKRFDDIFDSTRYAKALDAIRKSKTEYTGVSKELKADLAGFTAHLSAAEGLNADMEEAEKKLQSLENKSKKFDDDINELAGTMENFSRIIGELDDLKAGRNSKKVEMEKSESVSKSQKGMLDKVLDCTNVQLQNMLTVFDETMNGVKNDYREYGKKMMAMKSQIEILQSNRIDKCSLRGSLNAASENHQMVVIQRSSIIESIASSFNIRLPDDPSNLNPEQLTAFNDSLTSKRKTITDTLNTLKDANIVEDDKISSTLGELKVKQRTLEVTRTSNTSEKRVGEDELQKVSDQMSSQSRISKQEVDAAVRVKDANIAERDAFASNERLTDIPKEIKDSETKTHSLQLKIEESNDALEQLRLCGDEENACSMLERQVKEELYRLDESCKDIQSRYPEFKEEFKNVDAYKPQTLEACTSSINNKLQTATTKVNTAKSEMQVHQNALTESKALLKHTTETANSIKSRLDELTSPTNETSGVYKIKKTCAALRADDMVNRGETEMPADPNDCDATNLLKLCNQAMAELNSEVVAPTAMLKAIKKLKKLATKVQNELRCPCCTKLLDDGAEVQAFVDSMEALADPETSLLLSKKENRKEAIQQDMNQFQAWTDTVEASMNDWLEWKRIQGEHTNLKAAIISEQDKVDAATTLYEKSKSETNRLSISVNEMTMIHSEFVRLRDSGTRIEEKEGEAKSKRANLSTYAPSSDGKGLREVEKEVSIFLGDKETLMREIQDKNKEMATINRNLQLSSTRASASERAAQDKQALFDRYGQLEARRLELREKITKINASDTTLREQEAPLRQETRAVEQTKERQRKEAGSKEAELNNKSNSLYNVTVEFRALHSKIVSYEAADKSSDLDNLNKGIVKVEDEISAQEKEEIALQRNLNEAADKVNETERHKKNIHDNANYRQGLITINELSRELTAMSDEIKTLERSNKSHEGYDDASEKSSQLTEERARCEGRIQMLKEEIKRLANKLEQPDYKNIEEKHRRVMINYETTMIAVQDLDKYHQAVDLALLRYHGLKIEDINKIVRELWSLTYKGEDITTIKIVSGNEGAAPTKAARSYNYRVIMTKGNTELDMRGRCSAGQRVLASLVIRLALAETFCINCGVLALDEPTTNLDFENKKGLALALAQIIANRASQHNFQLITITHDEDFVSMMKHELAAQSGKFPMPEHYFIVSRRESSDGKHYSKIEQIE